MEARNLWTGESQPAAPTLDARLDSHDTALWRIRPAAPCGKPARTGTIIMTVAGKQRDIENYTRCLAAPGSVGACTGTPRESWTVTARGALISSGGQCLAAAGEKPLLLACAPNPIQFWKYTLTGNLVNEADHQCLTATNPDRQPQSLTLQTCGHNRPEQIWSLPN